MIPEQRRRRPLVCGLQIANWDSALRAGLDQARQWKVNLGTLGCFVKLANGNTGLLSNNHVIAEQNQGQRGSDRIFQPGPMFSQAGEVRTAAVQIAVLRDFEDIQASPPNAMPYAGNVAFNDIDAGVAELNEGISFKQEYLSSRGLKAPRRARTAALPGDRVFKVGRTTGLTFGAVVEIMAQVPVSYTHGLCWFRRSIVIEGLNGSRFSDQGDSGSIIVRTNGEVVGLLYAGNGQQSYACPIDVVLQSLGCTLA